jgi:hypothetical protein
MSRLIGKNSLFVATSVALIWALVVFIPGLAQDTDVIIEEEYDELGEVEREVTIEEEYDADLDEDVESDVSIDDVLDDPEEYMGCTVTLEGEIDRVHSDTVFVMEDLAQGTFGFGEDRILVLSAGPDMQLVGELEEGENVQATGVVHEFSREELESRFGSLEALGIEEEEFLGEPVLIMGERKPVAIYKAPEPVQEPPLAKPEPEPIPEAAPPPPPPAMPEPPAPPVYEEEELPETASGLPLLGLIGLLSAFSGLAIRRFR